jgi:UDP-N-acetylglucosamine--N-acetylmuramyl-(pentapeptide) pyrophosphoryl-undecaprenol N-acetylglucosamine transferase
MVLAAGGMQIPRFIHEQNAIPGQTNRLLARFAGKVFITLEESARYFPPDSTLLTGNPLRRQILGMVDKAKRDEGFHLFIFGGSQGAHAINSAMVEALPALKRSLIPLTITHQTGDKECADVASAYRAAGVDATVTAFISDMAVEYAKADLIICRAGATTIAEVTACGKACLFIPFPHAVDDHQRRNAEALLKKDACFMVLEQELSGGSLAHSILTLASDPELIRRTGKLAFSLARLDAARIIVDELTEVVTAS